MFYGEKEIKTFNVSLIESWADWSKSSYYLLLPGNIKVELTREKYMEIMVAGGCEVDYIGDPRKRTYKVLPRGMWEELKLGEQVYKSTEEFNKDVVRHMWADIKEIEKEMDKYQ